MATVNIVHSVRVVHKRLRLPVGSKSLFFGAHQFIIHPAFVFLAWWKLYGFPYDPRLWIAFFVHDLGYWGKPNMDGPEGESHVIFGARLMGNLFGPQWGQFCLAHSRSYAKTFYNNKPSRLCYADKLAMTLEPWWLYLPRAWASGELKEYVAKANSKYNTIQFQIDLVNGVHSVHQARAWHTAVVNYLKEYVKNER